MRVLIVGPGYVGLPLGSNLARQGHEVYGLRRSATADREQIEAGIKPLRGDIAVADDLARLPSGWDWVVNCVAAGGGTPEDYQRTYLLGTRNLLDWLRPAPPRCFVYTSSTGVYGQNDGSLVSETDPTSPAGETGGILVATEKLLLNAVKETAFPAVILRLAGIYGPGRGYWLRQFIRGEACREGDGVRFLNMIHRDDVVGAIEAALNAGRPGAVFNVVDNEPVSQSRLWEWLARRLGKPLPASLPESGLESRRRGATHKRVSNDRLKTGLGYELKYPSFREGFEAEIVRGE